MLDIRNRVWGGAEGTIQGLEIIIMFIIVIEITINSWYFLDVSSCVRTVNQRVTAPVSVV